MKWLKRFWRKHKGDIISGVLVTLGMILFLYAYIQEIVNYGG